MSGNWTGAKSYYDGKPIEWYYDRQDEQEIKSASVHRHRNEALLVERMADKFTFCIVEKQNPTRVLYEPRIDGDVVMHDDIEPARNAAQQWIDDHPDGLEHKSKSELLNAH